MAYNKREWQYEGVHFEIDGIDSHPVKEDTGLLRFVLRSTEDAIALREFLQHNESTLETLHKRITELETQLRLANIDYALSAGTEESAIETIRRAYVELQPYSGEAFSIRVIGAKNLLKTFLDDIDSKD